MKKLAFIFILLPIMGTGAVAADYSPGEIYVKFSPGFEPGERLDNLSGLPEVDRILTANGLLGREKPFARLRSPDISGLGRVYRFILPQSADTREIAAAVSAVQGVEYAEPAVVRSLCIESPAGKGIEPPGIEQIPNDPFFPLQWGLRSVYAPAAWDVTQGSGGVVIAIVDNGVDWDHPDLADRIWRNDAEIPANGVDDDSNGFVDDIRGWDFVGLDNDPSVDDDLSSSYAYHGTHVSGIAAATMNNGRGVTGVAPRCAIMPVKAGAGEFITQGALGIIYAHEMGAQIINCSWGGEGASSFEEDAVAYAVNGGALMVAAAGNQDLTGINHFPSAYPGVLAVASIRQDNTKAQSNFDTWVDVSAPGEHIYSTIVDNAGRANYSYSTGTSMAAPLVSGIAGLVMTVYPGSTPRMATIKIANSCDDIYSANPEYIGMLGAGKVNAYRAVTELVPGIEFVSKHIDDSEFGDGDGNPESGETFDLIITLRNKYQDAFYVSGVLYCGHPYVAILQDSSFFGDIPSGETADNSANPFTIRLDSAGVGEKIGMMVDIETSTGHRFTIPFSIIANPPYVIHNAGNIQCTITNFGAVGFNLNPYNIYREMQVGSGFRYPQNGPNCLYHGSLVFSFAQNQAASSIYYPFEWQNLDDIVFTSPGVFADQETDVVYRFRKVYSMGVVNVMVNQKTYAWADDPDDDFIIMEFNCLNSSDNLLSGCYVGMFLDWEIKNNLSNSVGFNAEHSAGYMFGGGSNYYGMAALQGGVSAHAAIDNIQYSYDFNDTRLRQFMTGELGSSTGIGREYSHILGIGPFDLAVDSVETVVFALLAGDNYDDFMANVQAAENKYAQITQGSEVTASSGSFSIDLSHPCPNPFNQTVSFTLNLERSGMVEIEVFDILGREAALVHSGFLPKGAAAFTWDAGSCPSGLYFLKASARGCNEVKKLILMK